MEKKWKKIMLAYGIAFFTVMLIFCSVNTPLPIGEWDDYSLPVASILHDHNFGISKSDVVAYKTIFSEWGDAIEAYKLSGYFTKSGTGEMAWYFPVYSIACVPMVILLRLFNLPAIYTFCFTNLMFLVASLVVTFLCIKIDIKKKVLLTVLLSVNPIVFYLSWPSAEVFIYSFLVMALTFWYNRWYKRAAVFVSIAGMLNPTIMSIGLIMIVEYLTTVLLQKDKGESWLKFIKGRICEIIVYGCCYFIGLIPMTYNYINTGHINLTASVDGFVHGTETVIQRFLSYLFDLNYGIIAYFGLILVLGLILIIPALIKHKWLFLEWVFIFLINVVLYSIMTHINCGMSGISRYNAWSVTIILFAVCIFFDEIINSQVVNRIIKGIIIFNIFITGIVIYKYGPNLASNTVYTQMTPIASYALEKFPGLYNPLFSTFYSRTEHVDGGYDYAEKTPIVYIADDGYVRKILASMKDKDNLLENYSVESSYMKWWQNEVDALSEEESYISIPLQCKMVKAPVYNLGEGLYFSDKEDNGKEYVIKGMCSSEEWGAWTEGNVFEMCFRTKSDCKTIQAEIDCGVYNTEQKIKIYVNNLMVYEESFKGGNINFAFENPGAMEVVSLRIEMPEAISPLEFGYNDTRVLGLAITEMRFSDVSEQMIYEYGEEINFCLQGYNADKFGVTGISGAEEWGSWTEGNAFEMQFRLKSDSEKIHADIYCGVFNEEQKVIVYINNKEVYRCDNYKGGVLQFDFNNPKDNELVNLAIMLPNAISPADLGYEDTRILGLGISKIIFSELEISSLR